ncbi:uncharacterized protein LOC128718471 [Anopheles marshallii]|uniref:uncharacterized protein LOC128718471 n=1 Tax=Anopheles marshallii TaxID=1521116 RepID=UPI00237BFC72|nr:uncharacterized protein LOC128718471 [Anopheles marshallii]
MVASEAEDDVQKNSPPATTNNEDTAPSKLFYRMEVWGSMKPLFPQGSNLSRYVNRKIPLFPEAEQTAERLAETPEFKDAKNIKVNIDMAQESVKLQVLKANKTLFVAPSQKSDYLYAKIKLPTSLEEIPLVQQRRIVKMLAGEETYEELGIDQTEPLDMVVVGCVAVSERGQRIGKGNGYVDLEIGILHSLGVITPKTVIATTVADEQVYQELPTDLFQNYDFTVDLIVTPTRVIRVDPRPDPRAIGVQWGLLSSRRLEVVRVLKKLKERLEKEGQHIELKDEDTDVESFAKRRTRGNGSGGGRQQDRRRQQYRRRRSTRNSNTDGQNDTKGGNGEQQGGTENGAGSGMAYYNSPRGPRRIRKPRVPRHKTSHSPDEDTYEKYHKLPPQQRKRRKQGIRGRDAEYKYGRGKDDDEPIPDKNRLKLTAEDVEMRIQKPFLDAVRIRVSNMFSVPFKEFKEELRNRDCYPAKINQSRNGRCVLIFPKCENVEEQAQADELLQKLADMRITVPQKYGTELKQIELKCELQQKPANDTVLKPDEKTNLTKIAYTVQREAKRVLQRCEKLTTDTNDPNAPAVTNVAELVAKIRTAALLVAEAVTAASKNTDTVLEQMKPIVEDESSRENTQLFEHIKVMHMVNSDALAVAAKVEATVAALSLEVPTDPSNVDENGAVKAEATDASKVEEAAGATVAEPLPSKEAVTGATAAEPLPSKDAVADATVTEPLPSKETVTAVSSAVQEAVFATVAVAFAVRKLYEIAPPKQITVDVATEKKLTRMFGAQLPEVPS